MCNSTYIPHIYTSHIGIIIKIIFIGIIIKIIFRYVFFSWRNSYNDHPLWNRTFSDRLILIKLSVRRSVDMKLNQYELWYYITYTFKFKLLKHGNQSNNDDALLFKWFKPKTYQCKLKLNYFLDAIVIFKVCL